MYPELKEHKNDVRTIIQIESDRYSSSKERMYSIANSVLMSKKRPGVEDLIRMYESDGITPDLLLETGVIEKIPPDFYLKLAELHTHMNQNRYPSSKLLVGSTLQDYCIMKMGLLENLMLKFSKYLKANT